MSAIYFAIPTNAGLAKIANAIALGIPLKITAMAVGDGGGLAVTPDPAMTTLPGEKRRAPLNTLFQDPLNPAQLVAEQIIPENVGGWWIRCVGLYDDTGTLIAIANSPDTYKPQLSEGSGRTQTIRMVLIVSDTSAVELKIDPAVVLATRKYVDDLMTAHKQSREHPDASETAKGQAQIATQAEVDAGEDDTKFVTAKKLLAALNKDIAANGFPAGAPIPWPLATPPTGYLMMQGQSFSTGTYPKLAAAYPSGTLPDLRGEFIRGWDNGRGVDAGRGVLSTQSWQTAAIRGAEGAPDVGNVSYMSSNQGPVANRIHPITRDTFGAVTVNMNNTAGAETRPRNIAFNYIVRAA